MATFIQADIDAVVAKAESQLGVTEVPFGSNKTKYGAWYGMNGVAWCAIWVSWVFAHAGHPLPPIRTSKGFAYVPDIVNWAKANGCWHPSSSSYTPKRGDIVVYDFIGRPSHVGILSHLTGDGRVAALEGNTNGAGSRTGGQVMRHNRSRRGSTIGYVEVRAKAGTGGGCTAEPPKWVNLWIRSEAQGGHLTEADVVRAGGFDNEIAEVQLILTALSARWKDPKLNPGRIDRVYGPATGRAITRFKQRQIEFQKAFKQPVWPNTDTIVGPKTIAALRFWNQA